jgi:hypothetical protein
MPSMPTFTPEGAGYRIENMPVKWNAEFGAELGDPKVALHGFAFPYSGKSWDSFSVGATGSISFGAPVSIGRFDQLQEAARTLVNTVPAICVFLKPRMSGHRYVKELADRAVITWELTEPFGGIQDFTWTPTINRFQAVLRRDGSIEMSYDQVTAKDAIVGIYPMAPAGEERVLDTLKGEPHASVAPHLDIQNVKLASVGGLFLKVTFETRGPVLPAGDPQIAGIQYRVTFASKPDVVWTIRGVIRGGRGGGGGSRYIASGPGVSPAVKVEGNTISLQGILPAALNGMRQVTISADQVPARAVASRPAGFTESPARSRYFFTNLSTRQLRKSAA